MTFLTTVGVLGSPRAVSLRNVEPADVVIVNLEHRAPDHLSLDGPDISNATPPLSRSPRESKSMVAQGSNAHESSRRTAASHLLPVHVRSVREVEHRITSGPPGASHRGGASPRCPSG